MKRHEPASHPPRATGSVHVLIVEDKEDVADSLKYALTVMGHEVEAVHSGRAALAIARELRPDVLLCDLGLPDIDGYAVAGYFRADDALRDTYLVALSGYARPEDMARSKAAGFDHHMVKPPQLAELSEVLTRTREPTHAR